MRELIVLSFITLDGVMQAPGGPEEDPTGGFKYGGWTVGYWDDFLGGVMGEHMAKPFDCCLEGRLTRFSQHTGLMRKAMTRLQKSSTAPRNMSPRRR